MLCRELFLNISSGAHKSPIYVISEKYNGEVTYCTVKNYAQAAKAIKKAKSNRDVFDAYPIYEKPKREGDYITYAPPPQKLMPIPEDRV